MKHAAKVDWWIGAAVVVGLVVPLLSAIRSGSVWMFGFAAAIWIVVFGFSYPQSYVTTDDALVIRAGFSKRTIPYSQITAIRPSSDSRSALALSLDRVQVEYVSGELLIAPRDQEAFFADLTSRAPQLSTVGQELVIRLSD
jgi:hypothetical protein